MLLQIVLIIFVINLVFLGLGIATGLLLRLAFPSIEWGTSVLIGVVSSVSSICVLTGMFVYAGRLEQCRIDPMGTTRPAEGEEQPTRTELLGVWTLPSIELPTRTSKRRRR
jgi:hypothetical protein